MICDLNKLEEELFKEDGGPLNMEYLVHEKDFNPKIFLDILDDERFDIDEYTGEVRLNRDAYRFITYYTKLVKTKIKKIKEVVFSG